MVSIRFRAGVLLLGLSACQPAAPASHKTLEAESTVRQSVTPSAERMTLAQVRAVPESVTVDGVAVRITARLWRDLQPSNNYDPWTSVGVDCVVGQPGTRAPQLIPDAVWVSAGNSVWIPGPISVSGGGRGCSAFAWLVPRLPGGTRASVVVRLRGGDTAYLVRAPDAEVFVPE